VLGSTRTINRLDRAQEEVHATYLESEYQRLKMATGSIRVAPLDTRLLAAATIPTTTSMDTTFQPTTNATASHKQRPSSGRTRHHHHGGHTNDHGDDGISSAHNRTHGGINGSHAHGHQLHAGHSRTNSHAGIVGILHTRGAGTILASSQLPTITITAPPSPQPTITTTSTTNDFCIASTPTTTMSSSDSGTITMMAPSPSPPPQSPSLTLLPPLAHNKNDNSSNSNNNGVNTSNDLTLSTVADIATNGTETIPTLRLEEGARIPSITLVGNSNNNNTNNGGVGTSNGNGNGVNVPSVRLIHRSSS
jgi:hypothetical protein